MLVLSFQLDWRKKLQTIVTAGEAEPTSSSIASEVTSRGRSGKPARSAKGSFSVAESGGHELDVFTGTLGYSLKRAQVRSYEMFFAVIGENAISPGRMAALSLIGMEPGVTQSAVAEKLAISRPAIGKVIDALETRGLIERRAVEGNRRSYSLNLTAQGRQELNLLAQQIQTYEDRLAANLTGDERAQLIQLLEKVGMD